EVLLVRSECGVDRVGRDRLRDGEGLLGMPRATDRQRDVVEWRERRRALLVEASRPVGDKIQPRARIPERTPCVRGPRALWPEPSLDHTVVHLVLRRDVGDEAELPDPFDLARAGIPGVDHAEPAIARRVRAN